MCEDDLEKYKGSKDIHDEETVVPSLWQHNLANKQEEVKEEVKRVVIIAGMPTEKEEQLDVESEPTIRELRHCDPNTKIGDLVDAQNEETVNVHLTPDQARQLSEFLCGMEKK